MSCQWEWGKLCLSKEPDTHCKRTLTHRQHSNRRHYVYTRTSDTCLDMLGTGRQSSVSLCHAVQVSDFSLQCRSSYGQLFPGGDGWMIEDRRLAVEPPARRLHVVSGGGWGQGVGCDLVTLAEWGSDSPFLDRKHNPTWSRCYFPVLTRLACGVWFKIWRRCTQNHKRQIWGAFSVAFAVGINNPWRKVNIRIWLVGIKGPFLSIHVLWLHSHQKSLWKTCCC